uniref:Ig-like domain-containing protein n=1 Tax=Malurus cyaneus samueli TaxID=2593467 RepID=A0A8C5X364_9PASS
MLLGSVSVQGLVKINVKEFSGKVFLECVRGPGNANVTWWKDGNAVGNEAQLDLSSAYDDPRGLYTCETGKKQEQLQVHYRRRLCQNCIQVDAPTISVAVYCVTGHERGHPSRGEGWRPQLWLISPFSPSQPLGEREDEQYSRLAPARARR